MRLFQLTRMFLNCQGSSVIDVLGEQAPAIVERRPLAVASDNLPEIGTGDFQHAFEV